MNEREKRVQEYSAPRPTFHAHEPGATAAARQLIGWITAKEPRLRIEHVGSSAVPGCGGKGTIDLAIIYPDGLFEAAVSALDDIGFQRQRSRKPFPESRPMLVGCMGHDEVQYPVHAHVLGASSSEADEILWFRDRLRSDVALRRAYEAEKVRILAEGVLDGIDYADKKGEFIRRVLAERGSFSAD